MNNQKSGYESDSFRAYQREALKAACELCYSNEVIQRIKNAKTVGEISRIMRTARNARE